MRKTLIANITFTIGLYSVIMYFSAYKFSGFEHFFILIFNLFASWAFTYIFNKAYFRVFKAVIDLLFYFIKELIISNFTIIYFILSPGLKFKPAILELPLSLNSDFSIAILANLITLTPGTITLEVSKDKKFLYFHTVNVPRNDLKQAKEKIKNGFEKRISKISS